MGAICDHVKLLRDPDMTEYTDSNASTDMPNEDRLVMAEYCTQLLLYSAAGQCWLVQVSQHPIMTL